jgi:hypothetical protein
VKSFIFRKNRLRHDSSRQLNYNPVSFHVFYYADSILGIEGGTPSFGQLKAIPDHNPQPCLMLCRLYEIRASYQTCTRLSLSQGQGMNTLFQALTMPLRRMRMRGTVKLVDPVETYRPSSLKKKSDQKM